MILRLARPFAAALLATVVALAATTSPAAALPPPSDTGFGEARILWLMNETRRYYGLPPVERHPGADHIAQYSADVQARYRRLGHNPNLGHDVSQVVTPYWHAVAENIGCGGDADHLHGLWLNSRPHAANMLGRGYDTVGIGANYSNGCLWATVVFIDR